MLQLEPYFMKDESWYRVATSEEEIATGRGLVLTDEAPEEAVKSYEDYYRIFEVETGGMRSIEEMRRRGREDGAAVRVISVPKEPPDAR